MEEPGTERFVSAAVVVMLPLQSLRITSEIQVDGCPNSAAYFGAATTPAEFAQARAEAELTEEAGESPGVARILDDVHVRALPTALSSSFPVLIRLPLSVLPLTAIPAVITLGKRINDPGIRPAKSSSLDSAGAVCPVNS